jgi:hypothetical protein
MTCTLISSPKSSAVLDFKTNVLQFAGEVCLKSAASIAMATARGVKDVLPGPISLRRRHKLKDRHLFNLRRGSTTMKFDEPRRIFKRFNIL